MADGEARGVKRPSPAGSLDGIATRVLSQADAGQAFLALEAKWFRYAFMYDPILAMSVSKVDPLPHQIEAVYGHALKKPRIRFMLAHDPGAGKTIMAGLIIKEMKMRGAARRVLVVVPGQLREQWRWELKDKFDEDFTVVDRERFVASGGVGAWDGDQLITSIDFAKRDDILRSLEEASFDMVIVDEAHKMSAYSYGRSTAKTKRYRLGETLSRTGMHMLFLTATPHKGDAQNFRLLLDLLEPGFFAGEGMIEESVKDQDNPLFLRRAKEDMVSFDGTPLFVPRMVSTPDVRLSRQEKTLYNAMSRYVKDQYNLATRSVKGHNITFALIILQRRFASSVFALVKSLRRRMYKLEQIESAAAMAIQDGATSDDARYQERVDDMSEEERWEEEKKWELFTAAQNKEELRQEIEAIGALVSKAEKIVGKETKLVQLKATMSELDRAHPDEKVLVFTESRETLDYLVGNLRSWGYPVNTIHGSMSPTERKEAEYVFRDKTRVMVATEAAGEGINLQFCHLMVNYDLPWNPNRLEQRMGRIHRYGQNRPVHVFNLVAADTREGEIMLRLFEKLQEIKEAMGSDKVFDVISEVVPGKSLAQMLLDATVRARRQSTIMAELDGMVAVDNDRIMEYMRDGLATRYMDQTMLTGMREKAREKRLAPAYTRDLFSRILEAAGGSVDGDGEVVSVRVPPEIAKLASRMRGQPAMESYPAVAFDKAVRARNPGVDLVIFGHPVFDAALEWAESRYAGAAEGGAVFVDPTGRMDGHIVYCEGEVVDGFGTVAAGQLVACYVNADGARSVSPSVLLDLDAGRAEGGRPDTGSVREAAIAESSGVMAGYSKELAEERNRQAKAFQKYGIRSIGSLLDRIEDDMLKLLDKKRRGVKADLAIHNKREERKKYRLSRRSLGDRIRNEADLSPGRLSVVGLVRVVPGPAAEAARKREALNVAAELERRLGRKPELVSGTGAGFDIRSSGGGETRYILAAKAAGDGSVTITRNEWLRAGMLGEDCYLYLAGKNPSATLAVRNPAGVLVPEAAPSGHRVDQAQLRNNEFRPAAKGQKKG